MAWCKRCGKRFDRNERSNINHPKLCGGCARESERNRLNNVKAYYGGNDNGSKG